MTLRTSIPAPRIRPYHKGDRDTVIRILGDSEPWKTLGYTQQDWLRIFDPLAGGREGFVVEADGQVVGLALLRPKFLLGDYLELLAIAPAAQGNGHGSALLRHLEELVFNRVKNLFVCVSDFNQRARDFYERQGYQVIGPIPDFLVPGHAEILMRKTKGPARVK